MVLWPIWGLSLLSSLLRLTTLGGGIIKEVRPYVSTSDRAKHE
jgi:hypothetical protein